MRLGLPIFSSIQRTISRWCSSLNAIDFLTSDEFVPQGWDPAISSSMTLDNIKVSNARYLVVGKMGWINARVDFDVTGAATDRVLMTLPFDLAASSSSQGDQIFECNVFENTGVLGAGVALQQGNDTHTIAIFKRDQSNWAVATSHNFRVSGWVEIQ